QQDIHPRYKQLWRNAGQAMIGEIGSILDKIAVMEIVPGVADKDAPVCYELARGVEDPVGDEGLEAMLAGASRIDGIAYAKGIDPLDDGIADMKDEGIDIEEEPVRQETAPRAEFVVDAVFGLQRRANDAVALLQFGNRRGG